MTLAFPTRLSCSLFIAGVLCFDSARGDVVPDQSQIGWQGLALLVDIGGHLRQQVAQTYTAGVDGELDRVELRIGCDDSTAGQLYVEIQSVDASGAPDGTILGSIAVDSADLVPPAGEDHALRAFAPAGVEQETGTSYAIVVRGDEGTICHTPPGPVEGSMFAYPYGDAYTGEVTGGAVEWTRFSDPAIDYVFYTYVRDLGPDYCDIEDAMGVPNDWLPEDVPACACLEDPDLNAHRCWFGLPDFVLWREITPFPDPAAVVEWHVVPLNSGIGEIFVQESAANGTTQTVVFDPKLKPGKSQSYKVDGGQLGGDFSEVSVLFSGPRGDAEVRFRLKLDIQPGPAQ